MKALTDLSAASPCTSVKNKPNVTETDKQSAQLLFEVKARQGDAVLWAGT